MVFWEVEGQEYCTPSNETNAAWVGFQYGFATTEMAQMSLVALISTFFNIGVLLFHWTRAPHPKFMLRAPRRFSIRMHVLSGTTEIISWVLAWWWGFGGYGQDTWEMRDNLTRLQCIASLVHLATAFYQTPIVFGTQAVMIPAYYGCIAAKFGCTWDLWRNIQCARKSIRLYNVLSIYTWCRVFIGLFGRTVMFQDSLYSVSILLAGAVCLPSMGPGMFCIAFLTIATYQLTVWFFASPERRAHQFTEHGRDLFDGGAFDQMISAALDCPFADVKGVDGKEKLRSVFEALDKDGNGIVDKDEIADLYKLGHSMSWLDALQTYQERTGLIGLDFDDFCRVLGSKEMLTHVRETGMEEVSLQEAIDPNATFDTKARYLFDRLNTWASDRPSGDEGTVEKTLDLHDLAYVLVQYGIPAGEAKAAMRKWDQSGDNALDLEEFKRGFASLILFQIDELRWRVREVRDKKAREKFERELSKKQVDTVSATDRVSNLIDDTMDGIGSRLEDSTRAVSGAALQVGKQGIKQAMKGVDVTAGIVGSTAEKVGSTAVGGAVKKLGTSAIGGAVNVVDASFKAVRRSSIGAADAVRRSSIDAADTLFGVLDKNRDGVISADELNRIDKNRDGVISADELRAATSSSASAPPPRLADVEANASPRLLPPVSPRGTRPQPGFSPDMAAGWLKKRQQQQGEKSPSSDETQRIGVGR